MFYSGLIVILFNQLLQEKKSKEFFSKRNLPNLQKIVCF